ncbi:ABC transporter ATP-binding protein [Nocardioides mangrovicus]|uniref:ABC transporter ATP-binding protein n=1 Tax=Nocardioides mangrovicus TaxID=2478913 RepID=A0A3L8P401_9ACTN|nr:ABC transporter ATP-binding protein [Nocardioides mangrovicus]RLV49757.1 ABC transporter ATP-binding protein [Nocardioides mangrovicus]
MPLPLALRVVAPAARPQAARLGLAAGSVLVQVGLELLRPWPLALAVDHALAAGARPLRLPVLGELGATSALVLAALATVVLTVGIGALDLVLERSAEGAAERIGARVRSDMFTRLLTRSLRWHDRTRVGELQSRMSTDVGRLQDAVVATTTTLVPDAVMVAAVVVLMARLDPMLAVVGLSVVPVLALLVVVQRRQVRAAQLAARSTSGRLASTTTDLLRNIRAVQAFGRHDRAETIHGADNHAVLRAELRAVDVTARWTPVGDVVLALGTGLVLVVGGTHVLRGGLSVGALLVVLAYLSSLYSPVKNLARLSTVLAKASVSAGRVREVMVCEEAIREHPLAVPAPSLRHGIWFEDVSFGYEPGRPVISHLTLAVRAGETVCLLGASGGGKSTLTYLLLRLYDVDSGRVTLDGVDVRDCTLASLRSRFAYLPQDPWLLDATLAENIAFGTPDADREQVREAARLARVEEFVARLPLGYDTPLGENGVRLSGGQRRRVALARAVLGDAPMMLLDEPTASLDQASAEAVLDAVGATVGAGAGTGAGVVSGAPGRRTTLIVTHDPRLAVMADRVLELRPGDPTGTPVVTVERR